MKALLGILITCAGCAADLYLVADWENPAPGRYTIETAQAVGKPDSSSEIEIENHFRNVSLISKAETASRFITITSAEQKKPTMKIITKLITAVTFAVALSAEAASVTLAWDANAAEEEVHAYSVYGSSDGETFSKMGDVAENSYTIANLQPGKYWFFVTASNAWGESGESNRVSTPAGIPKPPGSLVLQITIAPPDHQ